MKRKTIFLRYCFVIFVVFLMTLALNTAIAETNSKYFSYSINSDNSINISGYAGNKSKIMMTYKEYTIKTLAQYSSKRHSI